MISKIQIQNYQSHQKTEINFVKGVNVITGRPQSGKTAILRALYWLIYNRPLGFRYHSHFAGNEATQVMIKVDDKQIWHSKDSKDDTYLLDKEPFEGVNKGVPDKITNVLNISELNIQGQLDTPFLITGSAGEVAKTINRITRLEKVDIWTSDLTKSINSFGKDSVRLKGEIKGINANLVKFEKLGELEDIIKATCQKEIVVQGLQAKKDYLKLAVSRHLSITRQLTKFKELYVLDVLLKNATEAEAEIERAEDQLNLTHKLDEKVNGIIKANKQLIELEKVEKTLIEYQTKIDEQTQLIDALDKVGELTKQLAIYDRQIMEAKLEFTDLLLESKVCPYCTSAITKNKVKTIMETI